MAYVAVKGGTEAIERSIRRLTYNRLRRGPVMEVSGIEAGLSALIGQLMAESSLYDEQLAALAVKQAEGSPEEAVFLLRAYRSTLPRNYVSLVADTAFMTVERRISASFKDIPGGQILGASVDYTHRLLDFELIEETQQDALRWLDDYRREEEEMGQTSRTSQTATEPSGRFDMGNPSDADYAACEESDDRTAPRFPKVLDYLRQEGLLRESAAHDAEPDDITRQSIRFPASRSARLQALARGQTGAMTSLAYASLRGYGALHPTVGELRVGQLPIHVADPLEPDADEAESYYIGSVLVTEVESFVPTYSTNAQGDRQLEFKIGYGVCYGQNETKAIAMSLLDYGLDAEEKRFATQDEEFVLLHIDTVESTGFISHLKLPHYVTFQSKLDDVRKSRKEDGRHADEHKN